MFKVLIFSFSLISFFAHANVNYSSIEKVNEFFVSKNYRQAKESTQLINELKLEKSSDLRLKKVRNFYLKLKANKKFDKQTRTFVLGNVKKFYHDLKLNSDKKVIERKPAINTTKIRPLSTKRVQLNKQSLWIRYWKTLAILCASFTLVSLFFFVRRSRKRRKNANPEVSDQIDNSLLSSIVKLSSSVMPDSYYIMYDFNGKITKFSSNVKNITGQCVREGMSFSDLLNRHFHKIGEGRNEYYISLHNTECFFSLSKKSISSLGVNICLLLEVDKSIVMQTEDYQQNFYLAKPVCLIDLLEDSLVEMSSFRQINLVDRIIVESKGNDTSFQAEQDLKQLFGAIGQTIKVIYEEDAPHMKVRLDTFQQKHKVDIFIDEYQFSAFEGAENTDLLKSFEGIKNALANLGGSLLVKNAQDIVNKGQIQIVFDQVIQRDLTIEEEFELQEL